MLCIQAMWQPGPPRPLLSTKSLTSLSPVFMLLYLAHFQSHETFKFFTSLCTKHSRSCRPSSSASVSAFIPHAPFLQGPLTTKLGLVPKSLMVLAFLFSLPPTHPLHLMNKLKTLPILKTPPCHRFSALAVNMKGFQPDQLNKYLQGRAWASPQGQRHSFLPHHQPIS